MKSRGKIGTTRNLSYPTPLTAEALGGGGGGDFMALHFFSLTNCQKLWHNCFLFKNTSFDTN